MPRAIEDHRRDRAERRPRHARRLQRHAAAPSTVLQAIRERVAGRRSRCSTTGVRDHRRRIVDAGRGHAERSGGGPHAASARRRRWRRRRTSSCWRSAATSRPRARRGRSITWATARASTWSAGRTSWWTRIAATGTPIVALLFSGRPASVRNLAEKAAAILELLVPRPGVRPCRGRRAVRRRQSRRQAADHDPAIGGPHPGVLQPQAFGASRLPVRRRSRRSSRSASASATRRSRSTNLRLDRRQHRRRRIGARVDRRDEHRAHAPATKSCSCTSATWCSSVTRPVKELKGFERVSLEPGETRTVTLDITPDRLAFYDIDMDFARRAGRVPDHGRARRRAMRTSRPSADVDRHAV